MAAAPAPWAAARAPPVSMMAIMAAESAVPAAQAQAAAAQAAAAQARAAQARAAQARAAQARAAQARAAQVRGRDNVAEGYAAARGRDEVAEGYADAARDIREDADDAAHAAAVHAALFFNPIEISNKTRLTRFKRDLDKNYSNNDEIDIYKEIKRRHIGILESAKDRVDDRAFGRLIEIAYNEIWGKDPDRRILDNRVAYNTNNYINIPDNQKPKGRIQIINTANNRQITVSSYGSGAQNIPKGDIEFNRAEGRPETTFEAAKRELYEETGINDAIFTDLNPPQVVPQQGNDHTYIYHVNDVTYTRLVIHMIEYANKLDGSYSKRRSADITSIHYKKYMKYKAKYLALAKSMGK